MTERDEEIKRLQAELARAHEENTRLQKHMSGTRALQVHGDNQISGQYGVVGGISLLCFYIITSLYSFMSLFFKYEILENKRKN